MKMSLQTEPKTKIVIQGSRSLTKDEGISTQSLLLHKSQEGNKCRNVYDGSHNTILHPYIESPAQKQANRINRIQISALREKLQFHILNRNLHVNL